MEDRFYCVGCGKMVAAQDASVLFKTGFFRVVHGLGCCTACANSSLNPAEPNADSRKKNGASAVILPLGAAQAIVREDLLSTTAV